MLDFNTNAFFDAPAVMRAVSHAERSVLSKFGAFVRKRARSKIRKGKEISQPGDPPRSHGAEPNIRSILFQYEPGEHKVIIGPRRLTKTRVVSGKPTKALEHGGEVMVRSRKTGKTRVLKIRARPFMGPSLKEEAKNFPDLWAGSVRG